MASLSTTSTPARLGKQIAAAGEGAVGAQPSPGNRCGDIGGGLVLGHIARLEPRHHDLLDAGRLERGDLGRRRSACLS